MKSWRFKRIVNVIVLFKFKVLLEFKEIFQE